jgi:hypothetical protein
MRGRIASSFNDGAAAWRGFILSLLSRPTREDCADAQTVPPAELRRIMRAAIMHHVNRRALHLSAHGRRAGTRIILGNRVA